MTYLFGFIGFCAGFYAGLMILKGLLRGRSNTELQQDTGLWWKYGWVAWIMAAFGCWLGMQTYYYFLLN